MSTTETKVRHTWAAQHTAGHETHGQTAIYDESTGKDIAIVYDGDAYAQLIVRAVNSHADMLEALEDLVMAIPILSNAKEKCYVEFAAAQAAIQKARGGA